MVQYSYDSWGNTLSIADGQGEPITDETHIGYINPYRYRGYRYDKETGLYYLQSRYYSAQWGRFINFDNYGGQVGDLLSHNGYMYCMNNPINMQDENGQSATAILVGGLLLAALIGTVGTTATEVETPDIHIDLPTISWNGTAKKMPSTAIPITTTNILKATNRFTKTKVKPPKDGNNYWEASLVKGNVVRGRGISQVEAKLRVDMKKDILCRNQDYAIKIASQYKLWEPEIDTRQDIGKVYYPHYHINGKHGSPHIWFYVE